MASGEASEDRRTGEWTNRGEKMDRHTGWDPLGQALLDYHAGARDVVLEVFHDLGGPDPLPVEHFFRGPEAMNELERTALDLARGRVLDLGAGVGSHALALQEKGLTVTALDALPEAVKIMRSRGVLDVRLGRWQDLPGEERYDTVLILMNGAGVAGTLGGMVRLLDTLRNTLSPGGRILLDSANLPEVLDAPDEEDGIPLGEDGRYPGELHYQIAYGGMRGDPVPQLFLDSRLLAQLCREAGLRCTVVAEEGDLYLAVIDPESGPGAAQPVP